MANPVFPEKTAFPASTPKTSTMKSPKAVSTARMAPLGYLAPVDGPVFEECAGRKANPGLPVKTATPDPPAMSAHPDPLDWTESKEGTGIKGTMPSNKRQEKGAADCPALLGPPALR